MSVPRSALSALLYIILRLWQKLEEIRYNRQEEGIDEINEGTVIIRSHGVTLQDHERGRG